MAVTGAGKSGSGQLVLPAGVRGADAECHGRSVVSRSGSDFAEESF